MKSFINSKKRWLVAAVAVAVVPLMALQVSAAAAAHTSPQRKSGAITIHSWLYAVPSTNGLSATVYGCYKVSGAIVDQGGDPTWNNGNYATMSSPKSKCGTFEPAGGYILVPPTAAPSTNNLSTIYAVHTIVLQKGDIFIEFAGTYNLTNTVTDGVQPDQGGPATWVITGGSGAYVGLQGNGTATANASLYPYILHTPTGHVYYS